MKENFGKYFFIIIVLGLIIASFYIFLKNNKEEKQNRIEEKKEYSNLLNLSICNFDTINPLKSKNKDILNLSKLIFEPLIDLDENFKIKYCIAKECAKISEKSYIIKLDEKVKWQDGIQVTSKDIVFTIEQIKKIESIYSAEVAYIEKLEIIDEETIKINLKEKVDFYEYFLDFPILPYHIYENQEFEKSTIIPLGTGRFKIKQIDLDKKIVLEKNDFFRDNSKENCKIKQINIFLYNNTKDIYNDFNHGKLDLINVSNNNYYDYLESNYYNKIEYKGREYDFISFNCKDNVLNKKEVRKAIKFAIDKIQIDSDINKNMYYIANFPLDYGNYLYNEELRNNKTDSKQILQESGWSFKNNKWQTVEKEVKLTIPTIELIVQESNFQRILVAEKIKEQLNNIGINLNIKKVSDENYIQILENKNYQMILTGINNGFSPDLEYFLGKYNLAQYENEELNNIIEETPKISDENVLKEKLKKIIEIEDENSPYIGLYRNKETLIFSKNINGEIKPNSYNIFYRIWTWNKKIK